MSYFDGAQYHPKKKRISKLLHTPRIKDCTHKRALEKIFRAIYIHTHIYIYTCYEVNFGQKLWNEVCCYWEHIAQHIENLVGTHWETLKKKTLKFIQTFPPLPTIPTPDWNLGPCAWPLPRERQEKNNKVKKVGRSIELRIFFFIFPLFPTCSLQIPNWVSIGFPICSPRLFPIPPPHFNPIWFLPKVLPFSHHYRWAKEDDRHSNFPKNLQPILVGEPP